MSDRELAKSLTLVLMYLTSWEEKAFEKNVRQAWKGYDFDIINELEDEELIYRTKGKQPLVIHEKGAEKAKQILNDITFSVLVSNKDNSKSK